MRRLPALVVTAVLLSPTGAAGWQGPPNILFILIDDMGWRDVGFMGSDSYRTPNIDRLAAEGIVFTNAYANAPNCAPTRASLLSGQYTPRHGIYTVAPAARGESRHRRLLVRETRTELDLGITTLAESLRAAGYATASVGKWHLGGEAHSPRAQGFDVNIGGGTMGTPPSHFWPYRRRTAAGELVALPDLEGGDEGEYLTDRLTDEAIRWMTANASGPFFLYMSHYAVHTPIQAKAEIAAGYGRGPVDNERWPLYAAMIESVDQSVERLVAHLDELGVAENTIVVFFSDNGGLGTITSMAPLRGMKGTLYEGGIRVPLAIRWPGRIRAGASSDVPVIGVDLYPTFVELAGAPMPEQPADGTSLVPLLPAPGLETERESRRRADAERGFRERPIFWHFPAYLEGNRATDGWRTTPAGAVRRGDLKLIEFFEEGKLELYDLARDIGEANDLSGRMPDKTRELHELLRSWRERVEAYVPDRPNPDYAGRRVAAVAR